MRRGVVGLIADDLCPSSRAGGGIDLASENSPNPIGKSARILFSRRGRVIKDRLHIPADIEQRCGLWMRDDRKMDIALVSGMEAGAILTGQGHRLPIAALIDGD